MTSGELRTLVKPRSTASVPVRSVPSAEITMSPRLTSPDLHTHLSLSRQNQPALENRAQPQTLIP